MKKTINKYSVTVESGVCFDLWATDVLMDYAYGSCVFKNNGCKVAFFDIVDIVDISLFVKSKDNNLFETVYERNY